MRKSHLYLFILFFCFCSSIVYGQKQNITISFDRELYTLEDSLKDLSYKIVNAQDEIIRQNATFTFIRTLVAALKIPNSYFFPFDSVKSISILRSDDNRFRIFTWHLRSDDGTYRYYGAIQVNNKEKLELYPLFDYSNQINNPEDTLLTKDTWYGAHYYDIITVTQDKKIKKYILLGWKGNSLKTTKKVIDVLSFTKEGNPEFGADFFVLKNKKPKRIIFEYNAQTSMMLRYLDHKKWIVYDHLAPPNNANIGQYEVYGPDLSYDGLKYKKGKWILMEKLDLRNEKSGMDKLYNDPTTN